MSTVIDSLAGRVTRTWVALTLTAFLAPPAAAADICEPACPTGAFCNAGECMPRCEPMCRRGFECLWGACVPACNPPCPAGQRCTGDDCVGPMPLHDAVAPADPNVPPRPAATGTGGIIAGWAMVGVGASTSVSGFLLAEQLSDECFDTECEEIETAMYVVGALGIGIAVGGAVLAITSHLEKAARNQAIRDWDARYGAATQHTPAISDVSVSPAAVRGGGAVVMSGRF